MYILLYFGYSLYVLECQAQGGGIVGSLSLEVALHRSPKPMESKCKRSTWARSYSIYIDTDESTGKVLWDLVTRYMWLLQYTINYISAKVQWSEELVENYYTIVVTPELRTEYKEYKSYKEKVESTRNCLEIQGKKYKEFKYWDKKHKRLLTGFRVYYTAKRSIPKLPKYKAIYNELRQKLLRMWGNTPYAAHYVDSVIQYAYNTVMKSWKEIYELGIAPRRKPVMKRRTIYLKNTLFRVRNGELVITIIPRRRYLKTQLKDQWFLERVKDYRLGAVIIKELEPRKKYRIILQYTKERGEFRPKAYISIDLNMDTIDLLLYAPTTILWITIDWSELIKWIRKNHRKRSRAQRKLAHAKRKNLRRALRELSIEYHNVTRDTIRKITNYIIAIAKTYNAIILCEDLKKQQMYRNKEWNKKLSYRLWKLLVQELKAHWYVDDKIDPKNTTRKCSQCGSKETIVQGLTVRCTECGLEINRQLNACINILKKRVDAKITMAPRTVVNVADLL